MTNLRPKHTVRHGDIVEIWEDGAMIGVIYTLEGGIRLVSKYLTKDSIHLDDAGPPAVLEVKLR